MYDKELIILLCRVEPWSDAGIWDRGVHRLPTGTDRPFPDDPHHDPRAPGIRDRHSLPVHSPTTPRPR